MATLTLGQLSQHVADIARKMPAANFTQAMKYASQMMVADTKKNFAGSHTPDGQAWRLLAHPRPSGGNAKPLRDTGALMASIQGRSDQHGAYVGTNVQSAALHQLGGVIRPKRGKYLAIPITKEAKRAGRARRFPRPLTPIIGRGGRSGVLVELPRVKGKGKAKARRSGGSRPGTVHYVLVRSVTVPARPFLGFGKQLIARIERMILDEAAKAVP